jgi:hypothetical protein
MNVGELFLNSLIAGIKLDIAMLWQMFLANPWPAIGFIALLGVFALLSRVANAANRSPRRHPRY